MDHNDKRNSSVPLGTFEPTEPDVNAESSEGAAVDALDAPFEGREDTWPNFTVGADKPRRRTRTLMGVPGLLGAARDSQPEDAAERPTVPDSEIAREDILHAIAEELDVAGKMAQPASAAEPVQVPIQVGRVDPEFDPEAQEVTSVYDADVLALPDSTPPPAVPVSRAVAEADGGVSLIEVAPPLTPEEVVDLRNTIPELPSELAGGIPLLTDHMRLPKQERPAEPITITEIAPAVAADGGASIAPASQPPGGPSSLAPREVLRKREGHEVRPSEPATGRNGALLVAAVMLLATGAWFLTSGTFRRASLSEAPAPAPTTAAVSQPLTDMHAKSVEPTSKAVEAEVPQVKDSADVANAALAANAQPGHVPPPSAAAPAQPGVAGPNVKGKPTLTATSRSLRVKPAPRAKPALVPPPGPPPGNEMPEQPTRSQVVERLESVRSSVRACAAGRSGVADLDITIAHTGSVMHVLVGGDFAGTTEGSCIARAVRTARFPTFKQERFRLLFPYAI